MKLELKQTKKQDLSTLSEIYRIEFSKPPYNEGWTSKKAINQMNNFFKNDDIYTIFVDNEIAGFIVVNPNFMCPGEVAFGEEMAVRKDLQNKGIGTFVLKEIFKIYKQKGFKRFMGVLDVGSRANNLYKRLGILPSKKDILIEKQL